MRYIGVDMASQPINTGMVVLETTPDSDTLTVVAAQRPTSDADILRAVAVSDEHLLAIDAPLGWPMAFRHQMDEWTIHSTRALRRSQSGRLDPRTSRLALVRVACYRHVFHWSTHEVPPSSIRRQRC